MKRSIFVICILLILNIVLISFLIARDIWLTKIDDKTISIKEFEDSYSAITQFRAMSSPVPVSKKDIAKVLKDKDSKKLFLIDFENQQLLLHTINKLVKKNKFSYNERKIDRLLKSITVYLKKQLVISNFVRDYFYPKIKIKDSDVNKAYRENKNKAELKNISPRRAKKYIKKQLKAQKLRGKLERFYKKLRGESSIIRNERVIGRW
jgi:hypothetical protein